MSTNSLSSFNVIFGQVRAFYQIKMGSQMLSLVAYTPLDKVQIVLGFPRGKWNNSLVKVANIIDIISIVAIWEAETSRNIYILRKHPGLAMLQDYECGIENDNEGIDNSKPVGEEDIQ